MTGEKTEKTYPKKRPPRPKGRDKKRLNMMRMAIDLSTRSSIYEIAADLPHLDTSRFDLDGNLIVRKPGRPPALPPEAYLIFSAVMAYTGCGERDAEAILRDPLVWEPIRQELYRRFPQYPRLAPGGAGPTRRSFWRWQESIASRPQVLNTLVRRFQEAAGRQAVQMDIFSTDRTNLSDPNIADMLIGDGTVAKAMFNASPGDLQLNTLTGELEQIRYDPDARRQVRKSLDDAPQVSDVAGTHYGLIHGTTGHPNEIVLLDLYHVPVGPGLSEAKVSLPRLASLSELLPGAKGAMWDKAMHGKELDTAYQFGLPIHAKVSLAPGARPKQTLIEIATIRLAGQILGELPLLGIGGAAHVQVDVGADKQHVRLIPTKTIRRQNRTTRARGWRFMQEYQVPDDPRIPARLRGGTIRVRLDTTDEDRRRKINRAENLRPIAIGDHEWAVVGGPRSRAETVNSKAKHKWPNGRVPAVGVGRQTMRLLGFGISLNWEALHNYEQRTATASDPPSPELLAA